MITKNYIASVFLSGYINQILFQAIYRTESIEGFATLRLSLERDSVEASALLETLLRHQWVVFNQTSYGATQIYYKSLYLTTHNGLFFTSSFSGPRMVELLVLRIEVRCLQEKQQPRRSLLSPVRKTTHLTKWLSDHLAYLCSAPSWPIKAPYNFVCIPHILRRMFLLNCLLGALCHEKQGSMYPFTSQFIINTSFRKHLKG